MADRLMEELARVAREEAAREDEQLERWDALSSGRLTAAEEEELRAAAEASEETAAKWQIFRPLEAEFRAQVVGRLRRQVGDGAAPPAAAPEAVAQRVRRLPDVLRSWLSPRWTVPAALAAAALALVLWSGGRPPPLADYRLDWTGRVQPLRSPDSSGGEPAPVVAAGNRLELVLTPATAVEGPLAARAFVTGEGAPAALLEGPAPVVSEKGSVRFAGVVGRDIRLPPGEWQLLVVVGRPRSLPSADELVERIAEPSSVRTRDWLAWKLAVRVE